MKKLISMLLCVAMIISLMPAAYAEDVENTENSVLEVEETLEAAPDAGEEPAREEAAAQDIKAIEDAADDSDFASKESVSESYLGSIAITTQPADQTVAVGNTASFKVAASGTGLSYQWQVSSNGGSTWTNCTAVGYNTANYSFKAAATFNGRQYRCVVKDASGSNVTSNAAKLTVSTSAIVINTQPADQNVEAGKTASFKIIATGTGLSYQWQVSSNGGSTWTNCSAAGYNTASYSFKAAAAFNGRQYRCVVKDANGGTVTSDAAMLTVSVSSIVINTQPANQTVTIGNTANFKVVATGTGLSYQWQVSSNGGSTWTNCSAAGYNTANYSFKAAATFNGRQYRCVVKDASGSTVTSNAAKLTVSDSAIVINTQPAKQTVKTGENASFKIVATGTGLSYQWQVSSDGGSTWTNCTAAGCRTASYTFKTTAVLDGRQYRCEVKDANGNSVISNAAKLTLISPPIVINTQPAKQTVTVGENASFKIVASGTGLSYQWQMSSDGGSTWTNCAATGCRTASYSFKTISLYSGRQYRCVVKDTNGNSITSNAAVLTVKPALAITAQPVNKTVTVGETAAFSVTASGTGLSYQWQVSSDGGSTWRNCSAAGYNTANYSFKAAATFNGRQYRCVVKDTNGNSVTSNAAVLTVKPALAITAQPVNKTVTVGKTAAFSVTASGDGLKYQWQVSSNGGSKWTNCSAAGYNTANYSFKAEAVYNGRQYRCVVKDANGNSVTSNAAVLTVKPALAITAQPVNKTVTVGETAAFSVTASGDGLKYQWQVSSDGGSTWTNCTAAGYNTASYSFTVEESYNGRLYRCVVNDFSGNSVTSNAVELTVNMSGSCGDNLHWRFDEDGTLTISGTGYMYDYYFEEEYPEEIPGWYGLKVERVIIEEGVTSIGDWAFGYCSSLTSVDIPDSVTSIGNYAFYDCSSLTSVVIGNRVTSIGDGAFRDCSSLTSVNIPDSVTSIGYGAFYGCSSLTSVNIPDSVTSIGEYAFYYCSSLTSVEIPDSVTSIGYRAFYYCSSLTSVEIPDSVTSIDYSAFSGCNMLKTVYFKGTEAQWAALRVSLPSGATVVYNYGKLAFTAQPESIEVYVGETASFSVLAIGDGLKYQWQESSDGGSTWTNCTAAGYNTASYSFTAYAFHNGNLYRCIVSNIEGNSVTSNAAELTVNMSGSCGDNLHWRFDEDGTLTISGTGYMYDYHYVDAEYFEISGWDGLKVERVIIEDGVTSIGNSAFAGCSSLTRVVIPDSVTSIGDFAFWNCSSLTSVEIPESVTSIGDEAFKGCKKLADENGFVIIRSVLYDYCGNASSVIIPTGVTSIGEYAFYYCSSLTSVVIPGSVTSIGNYAFYGCNMLKTVHFKGTEAQWAALGVSLPSSAKVVYNKGTCGDNLRWALDGNGTLTISGTGEMYNYSDYNKSPWSTDINKIIVSDGVTSIGYQAFYGCSSLTSVDIPDSVTSIGYDAFYGCSSLTSVVIPDSVTSIASGAFRGCSSLTSVDIPDSVTSIGGWAFYCCSSLTSVEIPDSVTSIGDQAFRGCKKLADENGFVIIRSVLYDYCGDASSVIIPTGVTSIGDYAFFGCSSLTSVEIPDSVTSIGVAAFANCFSLTNVEIPDSVTSIGENAFGEYQLA